MNPEKRFLTLLTQLANLSGMRLAEGDGILEIYDTALSPLGYSRLCVALLEIITTRRARDPFPSIRDIREIIEPETKPEDDAVLVVGRIWEACNRFGGINAEMRARQVEEFVGPLGWATIRALGGWFSVQESSYIGQAQEPSLKAQWRECAKAVAARAKAGKLGELPQLPQARRIDRDADPESAGDILKRLTGGKT